MGLFSRLPGKGKQGLAVEEKEQNNKSGQLREATPSVDDTYKKDADRAKVLLKEIFKQYVYCEGIQIEGFEDATQEECWKPFIESMRKYLSKQISDKNNKYLMASHCRELLELAYKMGDISFRLEDDNYYQAYMEFLHQKDEDWFMRI